MPLMHLQEQHEADAKQLQALNQRVEDLQDKLAASKQEEQQLRELLERSRTLQAEAMREVAANKEVRREGQEQLPRTPLLRWTLSSKIILPHLQLWPWAGAGKEGGSSYHTR